MVTKRLVKAKALAERWDTTEAHIHTLSREGLIPSIAIGRSRRYDLDAIAELEASGGFRLAGGWRREQRESA
ncbi:MAG: DNA-binding protein [Myxococcota bacterium]